MNNSLWNIHVNFLAGVGWRVTPTGYILTIFKKRILVDCGYDKEGILKILNAEEIDAVLLTHAHVDHIGSLLYFYLANKDCPIFIPQGSKKAMKIALLRGYEIQSRWSENEKEYKDCTKWLQESRELLTKLMNNYEVNHQPAHEKMNRTGRKQESIDHETREELEETENVTRKQNRKHAKNTLTARLWLEWYDLDKIGDLRELAVQDEIKLKWTMQHMVRTILNKRITAIYEQKMKNLADSHVLTRQDADTCIKNLQELTLGKFHKIFDGIENGKTHWNKIIEVMPLNSGHLYSSTAWMYAVRVGWKTWLKILLTGDLWNESLPHPYPKMDISALKIQKKEEVVEYQKMDLIISEGTYGYILKHDYEKWMRQFEEVLIDAIRTKKDIVIPIISLDRPIYGMWEIVTRLFEKGSEAGKKADIKPEEVEMLYVGQDMASFFPTGNNNVMWKKIQKHFKPLERDRILSRKWARPRIIFAAGGFIQPESPAAWILVKSLQICDTQVVVINYCGEEGSNGDNAISGRDFTALEKVRWGEKVERNLKLSWRQKGHRIGGLSGHADAETIIWLWGKLAKTGAKIFIQHSSDLARKQLKKKALSTLREKKLEILLPRKGKPHPIKKIFEKK